MPQVSVSSSPITSVQHVLVPSRCSSSCSQHSILRERDLFLSPTPLRFSPLRNVNKEWLGLSQPVSSGLLYYRSRSLLWSPLSLSLVVSLRFPFYFRKRNPPISFRLLCWLQRSGLLFDLPVCPVSYRVALDAFRCPDVVLFLAKLNSELSKNSTRSLVSPWAYLPNINSPSGYLGSSNVTYCSRRAPLSGLSTK